jgi:hypothetical protein
VIYFKAVNEVGRQLTKEQNISQKTFEIVGCELLPKEMYVKIMNQYFQQTLETLNKY